MSDYTVVVGLGNPETAARLMRIGCMMAKQFDGRIEAVTVVDTDHAPPVATPERHDRMSAAYDLLATAEVVAGECEACSSGHIAIGRPVAEVLDELAESTDASLIVIGYSERTHPDGDSSDFERLTDEIATRAPCDLLVARFVGEDSCRRVLVPVREELNLDVRRDVLVALQEQYASAIDVVHFTCTEDDIAPRREQLRAWLDERGMTDRVTLRVDVREEPAEAIVQASANYDLVMLGAGPLHEVRRRYFGPITEYVATHAASSTFLLRTRDITSAG